VTDRTSLDGALWLIARGFATFPADHPGNSRCTGIGKGHDSATCTDRGKHPCVAFSRVHTRDEQQAYRWFGEHLRNVAVPVGAYRGPDGARLLVVDSDRPNAIEDTASDFGEQHTPTMRVATAKGTHDYYEIPADAGLGNGLGALRGRFDGDVRAGNAYVISVGSVHATGVVYELDDDRPPAPAPAWLLTALRQQRVPEPRRAYIGPPRGKQSPLLRLVQFVLESRHERNNRLFWASCRAFEQARETGDVEAAVASALLDAAMHVGLSESEARSTIRNAYRKAAQ
jgi:hypothetical protein